MFFLVVSGFCYQLVINSKIEQNTNIEVSGYMLITLIDYITSFGLNLQTRKKSVSNNINCNFQDSIVSSKKTVHSF